VRRRGGKTAGLKELKGYSNMTIDDPVRTTIQQARNDLQERSGLVELVKRLGISSGAAAVLSGMPFVSQIVTSLIAGSSTRSEERFLAIAEALEEQQKRFERDIPYRSYYDSDEFAALFHLVLERLHSTHQKEKLKAFGRALGNCGRRTFEQDDREQFIRVLRDLSLGELHVLQNLVQAEESRAVRLNGGVARPRDPAWARLTSLGLIEEKDVLRKMSLRVPTVPLGRQSPEGYTRAFADALNDYFKQAPVTICRASGFGRRFLAFVAEEKQDLSASETTAAARE
jgi:hypothetical protein